MKKNPHIMYPIYQLRLCVRLSASKLKYLQRLKNTEQRPEINNGESQSSWVFMPSKSYLPFFKYVSRRNNWLTTCTSILVNDKLRLLKYDFIPITSYSFICFFFSFFFFVVVVVFDEYL